MRWGSRALAACSTTRGNCAIKFTSEGTVGVRVRCEGRKGWGMLLSEVQVFDRVSIDKNVPPLVVLPTVSEFPRPLPPRVAAPDKKPMNEGPPLFPEK